MKINAKKICDEWNIFNKAGSVLLNFPFVCDSDMALSGTGTDPLYWYFALHEIFALTLIFLNIALK